MIKKNILLIGDSCLDIYHYGHCERLSQEAPVPIFKEYSSETKGGMSLNVKNNLSSFGFDIYHIHNKNNIEKHRLFDIKFNTHIIRFDIGETNKVDLINLQDIDKINKNFDAIIISDYCKGFVDDISIKYICKKYKNTPIFVDTKKNDLSCFSNCIIKINEKEYNAISNLNDSNQLIVTLGDKGALYNNVKYPTKNQEVFDVCGAGDVFLSSLVFKYLENNDLESAIIFANTCASFSVSKLGSYVLTEEDIENTQNISNISI